MSSLVRKGLIDRCMVTGRSGRIIVLKKPVKRAIMQLIRHLQLNVKIDAVKSLCRPKC